jgi:hypothetical protein
MFDDPVLARIEQEALEFSRDLAILATRVDEPRACARVALSERLPAIGIQAIAGRDRASQRQAPPSAAARPIFPKLSGMPSSSLISGDNPPGGGDETARRDQLNAVIALCGAMGGGSRKAPIPPGCINALPNNVRPL